MFAVQLDRGEIGREVVIVVLGVALQRMIVALLAQPIRVPRNAWATDATASESAGEVLPIVVTK